MAAKSGIHSAYMLIADTYKAYQRDNVARQGAALAYYTIFSLPAIIIVAVASVGAIFGKQTVEGEVYEQIKGFFSETVAQQVKGAVESISEPKSSKLATWAGIVMILFGASGVFDALQDALHRIYKVYEERPTNILQRIIDRLVSVGMVLSIGFILIVSLIVNSIVSLLINFTMSNREWLVQKISEGFSVFAPLIQYFNNNLLSWLNFIVSFSVVVLFFAFLYKYLPDANLRWRHVKKGALFTASMFWGSKALIGWYMSHAAMTNAYGAAGTVVAIMLWVYVSSQLVFLGAELIKILSLRAGDAIVPRAYGHHLLNLAKATDIMNVLRKRVGAFFSRKPKPPRGSES